MELSTITTTFAIIVGLIANFKSERRATSDDEYKDFVAWLDAKRHKNVIEKINSNHSLGLGIKHLLQQNHEEVIKKLQILDSLIITIASQVSGLNEIASAISPNTKISDQAISIIRQLDQSGGSLFLEIAVRGGTLYQVMDGKGSIEMSEERFIEDDLNTLCSLVFLISDVNSQGHRLFRITRNAVKFLQAIDK